MNRKEKSFAMVQVRSLTYKRDRGEKLCEKWESGEAFDHTT